MTPLVIFRCENCGDTFPASSKEIDPRCPSCGSESLHPASEPLL